MSTSSKLEWYLKRVAMMPPGELLFYRPTQMARSVLERITRRFKKNDPADIDIDIPRSLDMLRFFIDLSQREHIIEEVKDNIPAILATAERVRTKQFSLFAHDDLILDTPIDWHKDYGSGKRFPLRFGAGIDYRDSRKYGDVKNVWEINRHVHLVPLAQAYYVTGEEKWRDEVLEQLSHWIDANPYLIGINWCSALENALRLINWCWTYYFIAAVQPPPEAFCRRFFGSIYQHCCFINRRYSAYSSANNHLIGEAAGVFITTTLFPFLPGAEKFRNRAKRILEREIRLQFSPDGVNREQAVEYHCFSLELALLSYLVAERNDSPFSNEYRELLHKAFGFLAALYSPQTGIVPQIGDSDNAVVLQLDESHTPHILSLLNTGAVLFSDETLKRTDATLDEKASWLLGGSAARETFESLNPHVASHVPDIISFEQGGYQVLNVRGNDSLDGKLIFDCGELGYGSLAAHGHADALSVVLLVEGNEILTDPGTYAYHTERPWRDYFRSTAAHNTVEVAGEDQSVIGGAFLWLKEAHAHCIGRYRDAERLEVAGMHEGYMRLEQPVVHRRSVQWRHQHNLFRITDTLAAADTSTFTVHFHFHPDADVVKGDEKNKVLATKSGITTAIQFDASLEVTLHKGEETDALQGWHSRVLGRKVPAWTVAAAGTVAATQSTTTLISFARTPECAINTISSYININERE